MSPRPDLGPKPPLGYVSNRIERAADRRSDPASMAALEGRRARSHLRDRRRVGCARKALAKITSRCSRSHRRMRSVPHWRARSSASRRRPALRAAASIAPRSRRSRRATISWSAICARSPCKRMVDPVHLPPLAEGKALLNWHARHRFCPNCGNPSRVVEAGWRRDCPACKAQHFPRTDPVVIMLAVDGERCLLGRSRSLPSRIPGRASPASSSRAKRSRTRCAAK